VVLDKKGISRFQLLQNVLNGENTDPITYFVFDIPICDGEDITKDALITRKKKLNSIFKRWRVPHPNIVVVQHISGQGKMVHQEACRQKLEGIISKNKLSPYEQKRTKTWLKSKCIHRQEFVIAGFTKPQKSRNYFGALLLGYYKGNSLIYCGKVGTGFSEKLLSELYGKMSKITTKFCSFNNTTHIKKSDETYWVKPKLIAEVSFTEWTKDLLLRHPSFIGLRQDKKPKDITKES
jgi:bifunctional non-homologous end joining protein LigD